MATGRCRSFSSVQEVYGQGAWTSLNYQLLKYTDDKNILKITKSLKYALLLSANFRWMHFFRLLRFFFTSDTIDVLCLDNSNLATIKYYLRSVSDRLWILNILFNSAKIWIISIYIKYHSYRSQEKWTDIHSKNACILWTLVISIKVVICIALKNICSEVKSLFKYVLFQPNVKNKLHCWKEETNQSVLFIDYIWILPEHFNVITIRYYVCITWTITVGNNLRFFRSLLTYYYG